MHPMFPGGIFDDDLKDLEECISHTADGAGKRDGNSASWMHWSKLGLCTCHPINVEDSVCRTLLKDL